MTKRTKWGNVDRAEWGRPNTDNWGRPLLVEKTLDEVHEVHDDVVDRKGQDVDIAVGSGSFGDRV